MAPCSDNRLPKFLFNRNETFERIANIYHIEINVVTRDVYLIDWIAAFIQMSDNVESSYQLAVGCKERTVELRRQAEDDAAAAEEHYAQLRAKVCR